MNRLILALLLLLAPAAHAEDPQTGDFHVTFTERSPLSAMPEQIRHFSAPSNIKIEPAWNYDIKDESFEAYVPPSYKPDEKWGILVGVNAGKGGVPGQFKDVLAKHKLMVIAANNSGNDRIPWARIGLAIDAQYNMKKRYTLDDKRTFISGVSGGGRISSIVGLGYPDVFTGGIYIVGCNYFRDMPSPDEPGKSWHAQFRPPPVKLLVKTKTESRHVLLTGEKDMNRSQTKVNYEKGFKPDGFKHVVYLEVPGMGHQAPPIDWFEKGLDFLDGKE